MALPATNAKRIIRSLHNERKDQEKPPLDPNADPMQTHNDNAVNNNADMNTLKHNSDVKTVAGLLPVQKIKVENLEGELVEILAMLDTGSNTSLLSKAAAKKLGLSGPKTHLTMYLAGGSKRSETSEIIGITLVCPSEEHIKKPLLVHTVMKPCSSPRTISKSSLKKYDHLNSVMDKLHLSGGSVDLLIGTDFPDGFIDVHVIPGEPGNPIAKTNCIGWYILPQLTPSNRSIQSIDVGHHECKREYRTTRATRSTWRKPTKLCTCTDNELRENKFVRSLSESTTLIDGRIQVKMAWKENGPPKRSNYDIALKRMYSTEKSLKGKRCTDVVANEVHKLVDQGFVMKIQPEEVDHSKPEWYLPLQAVFTPNKTTKVRLVFDSSCEGHDGLSLNHHLEKGPNYINNIPNVLAA